MHYVYAFLYFTSFSFLFYYLYIQLDNLTALRRKFVTLVVLRENCKERFVHHSSSKSEYHLRYSFSEIVLTLSIFEMNTNWKYPKQSTEVKYKDQPPPEEATRLYNPAIKAAWKAILCIPRVCEHHITGRYN